MSINRYLETGKRRPQEGSSLEGLGQLIDWVKPRNWESRRVHACDTKVRDVSLLGAMHSQARKGDNSQLANCNSNIEEMNLIYLIGNYNIKNGYVFYKT